MGSPAKRSIGVVAVAITLAAVAGYAVLGHDSPPAASELSSSTPAPLELGEPFDPDDLPKCGTVAAEGAPVCDGRHLAGTGNQEYWDKAPSYPPGYAPSLTPAADNR